MKKTFSIKHALSLGWKSFRKDTWFLIGISFIYVLVSVIPSFIDMAEQKAVTIADDPIFLMLSTVMNIAIFILGLIIPIGYIYIMLQAVNQGPYGFRDLFSTKGIFWKFFFTGLLSSILVFVGFILLIIPGIFLSIAYMFASYVVVDEKLRPVEALKRSYRLTKGVRWKLFGFIIVVALINIAGAIALGVGVLVTIPVSGLASVHVYNALKREPVSPIQVRPDATPMPLSGA